MIMPTSLAVADIHTALPFLVFFGAAMLMAIVTEVNSRRVPNWLTFSGVAIGILLNLLPWTAHVSVTSALLGGGLAALIGVPLWFLRGLGGGAAKLLIMIGACLGWADFLSCVLIVAVLMPAYILVGTKFRLIATRPPQVGQLFAFSAMLAVVIPLSRWLNLA